MMLLLRLLLSMLLFMWLVYAVVFMWLLHAATTFNASASFIVVVTSIVQDGALKAFQAGLQFHASIDVRSNDINQT